LRAETKPEHAVQATVDTLLDRLLAFSPHVEPSLDEPGLFWLDPNGLEYVHGDLVRWADRVHRALTADTAAARGEARPTASVVVGFRRGSAYAVARASTGPRVLRDPAEETRQAACVPLARLGVLPAALGDELALLGVHTVGEFLRLPLAQLRVRYGVEAARLHDFLAGRTWSPLVPRYPDAPVVVEVEIDPPDDDPARLLFGLKGALHRTADALASAQEGIVAVELALHLERPAPDGSRAHRERIETAAPTLDVVQIVELARLRLGAVSLSGPVAHVTATLDRVRVHARQVALLRDATGTTTGKPRELDAAARALARLRASFGHGAVTHARLHEAHLPEARFRYEPARQVIPPRAKALANVHAPHPRTEEPTLVRRVFPAPVPLPPMPTHEPERWLGHHGALRTMLGPYRVAGGWWSPRGRRERDYYYAETRAGAILWLFYDRPRRAWFLHGVVS
jgi:protein ImuB